MSDIHICMYIENVTGELREKGRQTKKIARE